MRNSTKMVVLRPQRYALDLIPVVAASAYSLRRLSISWTGAAIRVRRSSDNAEIDIGFIGEDLDVVTLLAFVGTGNGFVVIWYDQINNRHAIQATPSNQPQIVTNGVLETANGRPAIRFNGMNTFFNGVPLSLSQFTLTTVLSDVTQAGAIRYPIGTNDTIAGRGVFSSYQSNSDKSLGYTTDSALVVQTNFLPTIGRSYVASLTTSATNTNIWANGGNNASGSRLTLKNLFIGQRGDNNWFYDGHNSETIVYTTNRQELERNQGAYYSIAIS
jgi:hypothetical protein